MTQPQPRHRAEKQTRVDLLVVAFIAACVLNMAAVSGGQPEPKTQGTVGPDLSYTVNHHGGVDWPRHTRLELNPNG